MSYVDTDFKNAVTHKVNLHDGRTVAIFEGEIAGSREPISATNDRGETGLVSYDTRTQSYSYTTPSYGLLWFRRQN